MFSARSFCFCSDTPIRNSFLSLGPPPASMEALLRQPVAPASRSELLASRRAETTNELQTMYNTWERSNPVWAKRLTGKEAAAALGYSGARESSFASRAEMNDSRRLEQRTTAYRSSGLSEELQAELTAHDPWAMKTSISRDAANPTLTYVEDPKFRSRSELFAARRADNVRTLDEGAERNKRVGKLDAEGRVQQRIDRNIAFMQAATGEGKSRSRAEMLDARRRERADKALADYSSFQPQQPPTYSSQPEPFWKLDKAHEQQQKQQAGIGSNEESGGSVTSAVRAATLPNGSVSAEVLANERKWWVKPEHYPLVAPSAPINNEPFKLPSSDTQFLQRKLSSGPKREQRGYAPDSRPIADKITSIPPPSLAEAIQRDPFRQYSGAAFKFMPQEPREIVQGSSDTNADGYEFTQPLYSSFTADKTFKPLLLPARPKQRAVPAPRERKPTAQPNPRFGNTGPQQIRAPSKADADLRQMTMPRN